MRNQIFPWRSLRRDGGHAASQRLRHHDPEILRMAWKNKQIRALIQIPFVFVRNLAHKLKVTFYFLLSYFYFDFFQMSPLIASGDYHMPPLWLHQRPRFHQIQQAFLRVNAAEEKQGTKGGGRRTEDVLKS